MYYSTSAIVDDFVRSATIRMLDRHVVHFHRSGFMRIDFDLDYDDPGGCCSIFELSGSENSLKLSSLQVFQIL